MCACMPVCFQRYLVAFAKARPAPMIFITTSHIHLWRSLWNVQPRVALAIYTKSVKRSSINH